MNRIGIVINSLFSSQIAYYALRNINTNLTKDYLTNFIFFVKRMEVPCVEPECGVMRWEELWGFDGKVITTDIEGTRKTLKVPGPTDIWYYVYDLEWMRIGRNTHKYEELASIYQNRSIKIIARNEEYAKIIERVWNRKPEGIAEDFDLNKILPLIGVQNEKATSN